MCVALGCFPAHVDAVPLKLATWNLAWLTSRAAGDPALPPDVIGHSEADLSRLQAYARRLDADIVGIEEVDDVKAAQRLFPTPLYSVVLTDDDVVQKVGLAIKRPWTVTRNPTLRELDVSDKAAAHHLRSGLDVTVHNGPHALRVLVVHLKTGCWDDPLGERGHSCPILRQQLAVLDNWVLERQDEGEPFAIIGDFNRRMTSGDPFYQSLAQQGGALTLTTAGLASPCWGGEYFIDHILLGNQARQWLDTGSLRVLTYQEPATEKPHLSDHCPVSVTLTPR
ncbi:endonuclease/exonuclease/phosphatase family protein [Ameyamaea chiangmaiensis]|uniref:endonuclease/exonuclease/phosphatase family protein n=1 Tax=Ameyamaea chiangmaiensis TaxID=442969 RepID=UPI003570FF80